VALPTGVRRPAAGACKASFDFDIAYSVLKRD
jgi:hypothetical protein